MKEDDRVAWTVDVAWLGADGQGRVLGINQRFTDEFGWAPEAVVGQLLTRLIPAQFHDAHNLAFSRFVEFGRSTLLGQPVQLPVVTAGGSTVMTETCIQARQCADGWRFGAQLERMPAGGRGR